VAQKDSVIAGERRWHVECADNLPWLRGLPTGCCSLAVCSPPYSAARTYSIGYKLVGQAWVDWMIPRVVEMCRVTAGLVCVNMSAPLKDHKYSPAVEWLVADLTRRHGLMLGPSPYVYFRFGIPGSGGERYHRRDHEMVYCFARPEVLPLAWSDNTACGHPPRWAPGGEMSNRLADGARVNQWGAGLDAEGKAHKGGRKNAHGKIRGREATPSHVDSSAAPPGAGGPTLFGEAEAAQPKPNFPPCTNRRAHGGRRVNVLAVVPIANPGNVVRERYDAEQVRQILDDFATRKIDQGDVLRCLVGGGKMGDSLLAHQSEAPMSETLVEFFCRSYAPPGSIVLDPFAGSGTTPTVAVRLGRRALACDIRQGQCTVARTRVARETPDLFGG
jgi:DNA methylase